jgi:Concanavalin A-like lectin/glucanases superfamily
VVTPPLKTSVWDSNYQGVWHLPNGTTLSASDSTSHSNNGTINNASAAAGPIGGGASFNGINTSVDFGSGGGLHITGPITAETWINVATWPSQLSEVGIFGMGYSYSSNSTGWMLKLGTDSGSNHYVKWYSNGGGPDHGVAARTSFAAGTWHHLVGTFDGATWKLYLDGAANSSSADSTAPVNNGVDVVAGGLSTNAAGTIFMLTGLMDELRVSNTARSADWIATEYNNQSNPSAFLSVGTQQSAP